MPSESEAVWWSSFDNSASRAWLSVALAISVYSPSIHSCIGFSLGHGLFLRVDCSHLFPRSDVEGWCQSRTATRSCSQ